jgi:hypothetical protein
VPRKLELLRVLFWVQGGLCAAVAVLFALVGVLGGLGIIEPRDTLQERLGGAVGCAMLALAAGSLGAGHLVVGSAFRGLRPWARTAGLVVAVLDILCCCNFPLGTALGVYALVVLLSEEVAPLFKA